MKVKNLIELLSYENKESEVLFHDVNRQETYPFLNAFRSVTGEPDTIIFTNQEPPVLKRDVDHAASI